MSVWKAPKTGFFVRPQMSWRILSILWIWILDFCHRSCSTLRFATAFEDKLIYILKRAFCKTSDELTSFASSLRLNLWLLPLGNCQRNHMTSRDLCNFDSFTKENSRCIGTLWYYYREIPLGIKYIANQEALFCFSWLMNLKIVFNWLKIPLIIVLTYIWGIFSCSHTIFNENLRLKTFLGLKRFLDKIYIVLKRSRTHGYGILFFHSSFVELQYSRLF